MLLGKSWASLFVQTSVAVRDVPAFTNRMWALVSPVPGPEVASRVKMSVLAWREWESLPDPRLSHSKAVLIHYSSEVALIPAYKKSGAPAWAKELIETPTLHGDCFSRFHIPASRYAQCAQRKPGSDWDCDWYS